MAVSSVSFSVILVLRALLSASVFISLTEKPREYQLLLET